MSEENEIETGPPGDTPPGSAKPEDTKPEDTRPDYMKDEAPPRKSKTKYTKWALMHGRMEDELVTEGFNPRSVDICAQELEKDGYRKRPPKPEKPPADLIPVGAQAGKGMQVFAKGSPPEAIIDSISLPIADGEGPAFEKGLKFGASIVVLGVRVAQELSNLGVQQARPLIEMSKSMREGEALAAKSASGEAAMAAAAMVQQNLQPYLANMSRPPAGPNPMKEMITRLMEPMMQRMLGGVIPGAGPPTPSNWTKRSE